MAKLNRVFQKQFGVNAGASDVGIFGSLAASSPQYSKDPETIQSLNAFLTGWAAETIANNRPALEDFNALDFLSFYQLCYLFQAGIPEWDAETTYYENSICQVDGVLYRSLDDDNINNDPTTEADKWELVVTETPDASETVKGKIEIATLAEVKTGTDTARAVTPQGVATKTGYPDWANKVSKTAGTEYQASVNGWIYCIATTDQNGVSGVQLHIGSSTGSYQFEPWVHAGSSGSGAASLVVPIRSGEFYKIDTGNPTSTIYFVPNL